MRHKHLMELKQFYEDLKEYQRLRKMDTRAVDSTSPAREEVESWKEQLRDELLRKCAWIKPAVQGATGHRGISLVGRTLDIWLEAFRIDVPPWDEGISQMCLGAVADQTNEAIGVLVPNGVNSRHLN